jgi:hypothetical protein
VPVFLKESDMIANNFDEYLEVVEEKKEEVPEGDVVFDATWEYKRPGRTSGYVDFTDPALGGMGKFNAENESTVPFDKLHTLLPDDVVADIGEKELSSADTIFHKKILDSVMAIVKAYKTYNKEAILLNVKNLERAVYEHDKALNPNLLNIKIDFEKYAAFPIDIFPEEVQKALKDIANSFNSPVEIAAIPFLAAVATLAEMQFMLKATNYKKYHPTFWACIIAPPGAGKTPAAAYALSYLNNLNIEMRDKYKKDFEQYQIDKKNYDKVCKKDNDAHEPVKPKERAIVVNNYTIEKLLQLLCNQGQGILLHKDELAALINSLNMYRGGKGDDEQTLISIWGNDTINIDRVGKSDTISSYCIPKPHLCIYGTIQPEQFYDTFNKKHQQNGFIARFLLAEIEPTKYKFPENLPNTINLLNKLYDNIKVTTFDDTNEDGIYECKIKDDALEEYKRLMEDVCTINARYSIKVPLRDSIAKFETHANRLILLMQLIRYAAKETESLDIEKDTIIRTEKLIKYFIYQAIAIWLKDDLQKVEDIPLAEDNKITKILNWCLKYQKPIDARKVVQNRWALNVDEAKHYFNKLVEHKHGYINEKDRQFYPNGVTAKGDNNEL